MVAYSFKQRFVELIQEGTKTQTIRAWRRGRSRHARPGETLQIFTGLRSRQTKLLGTATCIEIAIVEIRLDEHVVLISRAGEQRQIIKSPSELISFARSDGFHSWVDLCAFWRREHPGIETFNGILIEWGQSFEATGETL